MVARLPRPPRPSSPDEGEDEWLWSRIAHTGNGCWIWRGRLRGGQPIAVHGGRTIDVCRWLYAREHNGGQPLAGTARVVPCPLDEICVNPFHARLGPILA